MTTMILYLYDIGAKNRRDFNRSKRIFYYNLQKLGLKTTNWVTKSTILVSDDMENHLDKFFRIYKKRMKNLVVYKVFAHSAEEIE
jgi:uncharacterized protein YdiU (UPF0061 family)